MGAFRAIVPLGSPVARRPLFREWALGARVAVLTRRPFTAEIAPFIAPLTRVRTLIAPAEAVATVAEFRPGRLGVAARWRRRLGDGRSGAAALEPTEDAIDDARTRCGRARRLGSGLLRAHRRRPFWRDALHRGLLARRARFLRRRLPSFFLDRRADEGVARRQRVRLVQVVVSQALHFVIRRLEVGVRNQHHVDFQPRFDRMDVRALFVEEEGCDIYRHLGVHRGAVFLHRFFLDDAQDMQRGGFGSADVAGAVAARAGDVATLSERRAEALARQLHQAEARDLAHLHPRAVVAQRVAQSSLHFALVALVLHVDEVDDDKATQVAQPQLAGDLVGRLVIGVKRRLLEVARLRGRFDDLAPELEQIGQVPLQLFVGAADAGGAADDAHPGRNVELVHDLAQLVAILALHAARHAAAARIVGHQYEVASGETDEGGERRPFVAALVLLDLDDQLLALGERVLDARAADVDAGFEKLPRDFLERKKSVALGAVVHERGFEAGLDPRDDALVDVAFSLFLRRRFDVEVYELLAFDDRDTEFLGLCRIEKHALHCSILPRARAGQTKSLMCRLVSHLRSWDHENAVVWLVGLQSLQCRTVNSADMLLARCSITITGWITNRLCRLRVHALVDMAFAVGSVGTGDRVASLVWGQKIAPSHVQAAVPQRKQRPDHKQNEGFKQCHCGRGGRCERRPARGQLPLAPLQGRAAQPCLPHPAHRPG